MGVFRLFILMLLGFCAAARAESPFHETVLHSDGAWCWFQDERAIVSGRNLFVGSISSAGDVQVTRFDPKKRTVLNDVLHPRLEKDDHDSPALLENGNGEVMAFYSRHGTDNRMNHRTLKQGSWSDERSYSAGLGKGFTYANPFRLSRENGRIYNFWRGAFWNPTYAYSDDEGGSWSQGRRFIVAEGHRPYVKYASNGKDTVHFLFTEAHPAELFSDGGFTGIHHAYYRRGKIHRSDGKEIRSLEQGITPAEATQVYDGAANGKVSWIWDVALEHGKIPVVVFSTTDPAEGTHRYHYARLENGAWSVHEAGFGGTALYPQEPFYSGGVSIDPERPAVIYISANADPQTRMWTAGGRYQIFRGETGDHGKSWKWRQLTESPDADNLRPIVPADYGRIHGGKTFVLWMQGRYATYTDYLTKVVLGTD